MRKIQIDYYHHATCTKSRTKGLVDHPHTHSIQAEFKQSRTVKRLEINGKYETKKIVISWLPGRCDALHFEFSIMIQIQTIHAAFTDASVSFFASIVCLFGMHCIVTCSENGAILIGLKMSVGKNANYKMFPQPSRASLAEMEKNTITFINKSNACCGYFIMRLSLHGIALMCLLISLEIPLLFQFWVWGCYGLEWYMVRKEDCILQ